MKARILAAAIMLGLFGAFVSATLMAQAAMVDNRE
jgi:hypothetical protein